MNKYDCIQKTLDYIEEHLNDLDNFHVLAVKFNVVYADLSNWFSVIVGYSISEYVRYRRLFEAAREILLSNAKITDISTKYGYDSPDSFSRAFVKFHGVLPSKIDDLKLKLRIFKPIKLSVKVDGGFDE